MPAPRASPHGTARPGPQCPDQDSENSARKSRPGPGTHTSTHTGRVRPPGPPPPVRCAAHSRLPVRTEKPRGGASDDRDPRRDRGRPCAPSRPCRRTLGRSAPPERVAQKKKSRASRKARRPGRRWTGDKAWLCPRFPGVGPGRSPRVDRHRERWGAGPGSAEGERRARPRNSAPRSGERGARRRPGSSGRIPPPRSSARNAASGNTAAFHPWPRSPALRRADAR